MFRNNVALGSETISYHHLYYVNFETVILSSSLVALIVPQKWGGVREKEGSVKKLCLINSRICAACHWAGDDRPKIELGR